MTNLEILKAARELLSDPKRWMQGRYAINSAGKSVGPDDPGAVCFCAEGAIRHIAPFAFETALGALEKLVCGECSFWSLNSWNDSIYRTHAEVLSTFDLAIALETADT